MPAEVAPVNYGLIQNRIGIRAEKFSRVYQAVDHMREKYGKHTVFLGSSFLAHKFGQHLGD